MTVAVFRRGFPGGVHPREIGNGKEATRSTPIRNAKPPAQVVIPLQQHIGRPCAPTVQEGDRVDMGQVIGEAQGLISAPVHASVSGKVVQLSSCALPNGQSVPAVVIENDFEDRWHPDCMPRQDADALDAQQLVQIVRDAGIVGLGGAAFPTAVKLAPPPDKPVDTVLLNGAECEPYLTCDHRLMLEAAQEIADGFLLAQRMLGAKDAIVGIEDNKPDAVEAMRGALGSNARVEALPVRYPQGGEKQLIYALTGRTVPLGRLPADVGVVVINVGTAAAISRAVRQGRPLIDKVITLAGRVVQPANLRARIGTSIADLVEECGGLDKGVKKVVLGGPMMGASIADLDLPVVKCTGGVLAFGKEAVEPPELACMHCGRCTQGCPMRLVPNQIDAAARNENWEVAEKYSATACMECGTCAYVCPSKRKLVQGIRTAKAAVQKQAAAKKQG